MTSTTIEEQPIKITTKLFIAILISTATTVGSVVATYFNNKAELYEAIRNMDTQNKIQELKFENLKLEVERNRMSLERMRDEIRDGKL